MPEKTFEFDIRFLFLSKRLKDETRFECAEKFLFIVQPQISRVSTGS